jgi:phage/plasmid-like protein (TIGR03299 family)
VSITTPEAQQPVDVNEEFYESRQAMMRQPGVTRLANGDWTGPDRGEVFGREGLDMTGGRAALYTTTPAWHGLGTVIPGGISDIDTVMTLGGVNYTVVKVPATYPWGAGYREVADTFHTVRSDTGVALGTVGRVYEPIQPIDGFRFLQRLVDDDQVIYESAGGLHEGRKMFISVRLPKNITVDADGINDVIVPFIVVVNSHDGKSQFTVVVTPWRPVCANTERLALSDAVTTWKIRHTGSAGEHIEQARQTLRMSIDYFDHFAAEETALARTNLAIAEFEDLISHVWEGDQETKAARKRRDDLHELLGKEVGRVGRTAYAAERAVTDYLDHLAPRTPRTMTEEVARATRLLEGTDDDLKAKAHKRLMLLTR